MGKIGKFIDNWVIIYGQTVNEKNVSQHATHSKIEFADKSLYKP